MQQAQRFDYIILGAGAAGLSLLLRMLQQPALSQKQILLIDRSPKTSNDRTWCFWEQAPGFFEHLVHHQWPALWVKHPNGAKALQMKGYTYKMIRGIDFYRHAFAQIKQAANVQVVFAPVQHVSVHEGVVTVQDIRYQAEHIFSSVLLQEPTLKPGQHYLLQHFKGWWIETARPCFNPQEADFMNFCTPQHHGAAFVYALPVSPTRALIEYTLFTPEPLTDAQYEEGLTRFINQQLTLSTGQYRITDMETGIIPMTNLRFPLQEGRVTYIGTAGGQTKASTGYTFQNIQKHSQAIVHRLTNGLPLPPPNTPARYGFYDSVLLRILSERKPEGADVFYRLFTKNPATRLFKFLDSETAWWQELALMATVQQGPFIKAAIQELRLAAKNR